MNRYVYFANPAPDNMGRYSWRDKYFVQWSGTPGNFQYSSDLKDANRFDKRQMDEAIARMKPVSYWIGEVRPA